MSIVTDRQDLADALDPVAGVQGHKYRPRTLKTGDAWPLLDGLDRGPARDFEVTWRVVVILPADERRASEWFDEHHELVAEALEDFGYVERIEPGLVRTDAGDLQAMLITVRKEA
ncbi:hypothetical protein [Actinoplanes sp. M2I2]|uniref:hypothetical protein n=1 Tax=Actinoplanes sp. M2I2 TaxID=1734444 RepID=UPI002021355E|nr:hypothetical protein [Actinoplanes sp. M2I2]